MRILVCDDRPKQADEICELVKEGSGRMAKQLTGDQLLAALERLFGHVRTEFGGQGDGGTADFDGFDLILIDNNLTHLATTGVRLTAEAIAGYLRAFTDSSYVVSLNKNPEVDFDLRYLVGDYATRADLALNSDHLSQPSLWNRAHDGEFQPWYWPELRAAPAKRQRQVEFLKGKLAAPILKTFGFKADVIETLSRHAVGTLNPEASKNLGSQRPDGALTFRNFFESSNRTLPLEEERNALLKRHGKLPVMRAVAGEVDLWFRRDVCGPQNVLVDVPHLLLRMPFLLGKAKIGTLKAWNAACSSPKEPFGLDPALYKKFVRPHRFEFDDWVPRPCFLWREIAAQGELANFDSAGVGDFVFCEDTSRFVERGGPANKRPREFVTEFEGPWHRRFVQSVKGTKYAPQSRFAL